MDSSLWNRKELDMTEQLTLRQSFSNNSAHLSYLESSLKYKVLGPTPRVAASVGLKYGLRSCLCSKSSGEADTVGPGTTL